MCSSDLFPSHDTPRLSDTNEAEKTADVIAWILRLGHLKSRMGVMKYRDEPLNMEQYLEYTLDESTHMFMKSSSADASENVISDIFEKKGDLSFEV